MPLRYWLLIILLGAVWGCSFLFNAILIREISPLWVSAGRVTIGAVICWMFFLAHPQEAADRLAASIRSSSCSAFSTTPSPSRSSPSPR